MKIHVSLFSMLFALIGSASLTFAQQLDVLVIGSTHSFSEGGESGVVHEKPFNPSGIAGHLQSILSQDPAISETVNVEFEDIYKTKSLTVNYSGSSVYEFTSRCYSMAQHYMWPDGKADRLANLRGEGDHEWDYIVLCFDPYITANFPGMLAEGVKLIQGEIAQSANPAQLVLLAQWPENSSSFSADEFNKVVYRVGDSAGIPVVPAGKAWDSFTAQDTDATHPTPKGEYLAASAIYSRIFDRNASTSAHTYDDTIAQHAFDVVQANDGVAQFSGAYTEINPFQMKYVAKRVVSFRETGTSTEDRLREALGRLDDVCRISFTTSGTHWDFNYGRGNDWWEDEKDYEVDPAKHDRSYGFPMHHYSTASAPTTMPYGIDKHYYYGSTYEDGTDLGIAYNMIRPGTRELSLPEDVRAIPTRLMWLKMREFSPGFNPLGDNTHMHPNLNDASAAFMYTLLSGRCPVVEEPASQGAAEWMQWLGHKIGYETAWQMSHLTTRAPGFRVLPSSTSATTVTPTTTETMTVQFVNPPQEDVTVTVSISPPTAAIVGPQTLVFTPSNYNTPQPVTVAGIAGASGSAAFEVVFSTSSTDEVYNGLADAWQYTNSRSATQGLSTSDKGTIPLTVFIDTPKSVSLNTAGADSGNTQFAGPNSGSLTWSGTDLIYTPDPGFTGKDGFAFAVNDGGVLTSGQIEIDVLNAVAAGTVSYNGNGSDGGSVPFDGNTYAENDTVTVSGNTGGLFKTGHSFSAWNTVADGSGTSYTAGATFSMGTEGVILFAQWVPDTYTISYDDNGATSGVVPAQQTKTYGVELLVSGNTGGLVRTGFTFAGWNTAANGSGQPFAGGESFTLEQSTTLYAQWNEPPAVNAGANQAAVLSGSIAWSPADISTTSWYDASDTATITESGGGVSQWNDKSGNGNHATQGTSARRPIFGSKTIGTTQVIDFDAATTQFLNMPLTDVIGKEVWSVIAIDDYATTYSQLLLGAGGNVQIGLNSSSQNLRLWQSSNPYGADSKSSATVPVDTPTVVGWLAHTDTKKFSVNGVLENTGDSYNSGSMTPQYIGRGQYAYLDGAVGEIIITSGTLTTEDRQRVEGYLAHKWKIAGSLPANHPHKTAAPGGPIAVVHLNGGVSDPDSGSLAITWSVFSGPASVAFDDASAEDTTATFSMAGTYVLELTASDGTSQASSQVTITVSAPQLFSSWISGFDVGAQDGPGDDFDGDRLSNAVENYFGTDPGTHSPGLATLQVSIGASTTFDFSHPISATPASDLTAHYRWSTDLVSFHNDGQSDPASTRVDFVQGTPVDGQVTVTATVSGPQPDRLFVDLEVIQE